MYIQKFSQVVLSLKLFSDQKIFRLSSKVQIHANDPCKILTFKKGLKRGTRQPEQYTQDVFGGSKSYNLLVCPRRLHYWYSPEKLQIERR